MEDIIESSVNAEPVANVEPQTEVSTNEPVNAEGGEVATPVVEKQVQSAEENAKYAAIRREAEQKAAVKAQDDLIAQMYGESHGIYTKADYDKAVKQAQEEAEIQKSIDSGLSPEVARELAEAKKFREQYEAEKQTKAQQEAQRKDFEAFMSEYPSVKAEEIPSEVWLEVEKGKSLVDAYAKHEVKSLKAKLAEYEKGTKTVEVNEKNAKASTGSVTGNGSNNDIPLTVESINSMSEKELSRRWKEVKQILKMR